MLEPIKKTVVAEWRIVSFRNYSLKSPLFRTNLQRSRSFKDRGAMSGFYGTLYRMMAL